MIVTIDTDYTRPKMAAAYLLTEGDEAAFVENNTALALPRLLGALREAGMEPGQVRWVIITHVHLDHAAGSQALMDACPNATLLAHPKAARHVIDPSRLVASAREVYGPERFAALYGEVGPVDASRVRAMEDGEGLVWGARRLRFFHTRGHANHHFCVHDSAENAVFTGDSFGIAYPELQEERPFIFASTTPTDFDAAAARASVRAILETGARTAYLTHFGGIEWLEEAARQLVEDIDGHARILEEARASDAPDRELTEFCRPRLEAHFRGRLERYGKLGVPDVWDLLELDIDLNAQGIGFAALRTRQRDREAAGQG